jgi:hypothetical protein
MTTDLRTLLDQLPPDSAAADLAFNVGVAQSPFTGGTQTTELPGTRWQLQMSWESLEPEDGMILRAIKAMCRGGAEVVHVRDFHYQPRRQAEPGAPVAAAGNVGGGTLLHLSGLTPGATVYQLGDVVNYLDPDGYWRAHQVLGAVVSDGAGNAVLPILPSMKKPPANGTAVGSTNITVSCTCKSFDAIQAQGWVHSATAAFEEFIFGI